MPPSVLHLSTYADRGGAARAASTLNRSMAASGLDSRLMTASGTRFRIASELDRQLWKLQSSPRRTWRSPARFGSLSAERINDSGADVVNLHWVGDGFLSIEQIGRITKPVVWSLYDLWPLSGTEHYGADGPSARWRSGYTKENRPIDEHGLDLDRDAWTRKRRAWQPMTVVPASTWLTQAARESALMRGWPVIRIPHLVDCEIFAPTSVSEARNALGLPDERPLILFLASAGILDERKGWDLLEAALPTVRAAVPDVGVVVVGPPSPTYESPSGVPLLWQGPVLGDDALRLLYAACDVTAVPSREDNMPLTAMEAQSTGRPVVAFRIGGLPDIVDHEVTGYLAEAFDTEALAAGLVTALSGAAPQWSDAARSRAVATWSAAAVVPQYISVYESAGR